MNLINNNQDVALAQFHYYEQFSGQKKVIVLLHGTGGDEHDLLPLVSPFSEDFAVLSLRGNVEENGMSRFFKRTSFGVFDEENIKEEAKKLKSFVNTWAKVHEINLEDVNFVGFSNGANMILALSFLYPTDVFHAALLHPMVPLKPAQKIELNHAHFFVSWSPLDQMISEEQSQEVLQTLRNCNAKITESHTQGGHGLTQEEVIDLHTYIKLQRD